MGIWRVNRRMETANAHSTEHSLRAQPKERFGSLPRRTSWNASTTAAPRWSSTEITLRCSWPRPRRPKMRRRARGRFESCARRRVRVIDAQRDCPSRGRCRCELAVVLYYVFFLFLRFELFSFFCVMFAGFRGVYFSWVVIIWKHFYLFLIQTKNCLPD